MEIEVRPVGGATLVRVHGRIVDGPAADDLRRALLELVQRRKVHTILDLENVEWFDSVGVGILVSHYVSVTSRGGAVALLNAGDRIRGILDVARLSDRFAWVGSLEQAIERVRNPTRPNPAPSDPSSDSM